jgi:hypothetical protein
MFEAWVNSAWQSLTPSIGGIALACVGIGIAIGVIRKLIDQFGNIKVLIGIGAIVVVAWAVRYVTAPPRVEVREVEKPVIVEKLVVDTSSVDAMKRQLEAMQKEKESLANMVNEARERARKAEDEIQRRDGEQRAKDDPVNAARTEFAALFRQAKEHPRWIVEQTEEQKPAQGFTITRYEVMEDLYLVKTVYGCYLPHWGGSKFTGKGTAVVGGATISVQDQNMKRVGLPDPRALQAKLELCVRVTGAVKHRDAAGGEYLCIDTQDIAEDFASGAVRIYGHDSLVREHFMQLRLDRKIPDLRTARR